MNLLHQFLSSWFGFNKQQRNGILVLCFIILVLFIVRLSISHFITPAPVLIADFSNTKLPEFKQNAVSVNDSLGDNENNALFVFNPNTVTKEQLLKLGFSAKTANTFINYRTKGAQFRKKEDVKKVYGVNELLYKSIEPYILLEEKSTPTTATPAPEKTIAKKEIKIIELNATDSVGLLPLPGIGGGYAKRILKYRSLLGGYYSIEQLKEVYGFSDSLFMVIKPYVKAEAALVNKLNLNTENFKELNAHPYISYEETKAIFNYRRKNGPLKSAEQVKEIVGEDTFKKIKPYLGF